jgi:hypothetical protein
MRWCSGWRGVWRNGGARGLEQQRGKAAMGPANRPGAKSGQLCLELRNETSGCSQGAAV